MNAVLAVENSMVPEDRIARLESDVGELKGDVKALNGRVSDLKVEMEKGFGTLRTENEKTRTDMEKGFGALRTENEKTRTDMEKGLGALRTSMESTKVWMLVTGVGSVIMVFVSFLGHALKLL